MLGAVLYNLIPNAEGSFQRLLEAWWLIPLLIIISLILFWRHTTLAYGDIKIKEGWRMIGAVLLLLLTPYLFGIKIGNTAHIELLLTIFIMDRFVNSISVRRSPFFVFDIGILIGLLSMLHPAYLLLTPYFLIKFYQIENYSVPHLLAQLLGTTTVWALLVFLFAEPNLQSVREVLFDRISPLLSPTIPTLPNLYTIIGLILFLLCAMVLFYNAYRSSISRVRFLNRSHFTFAWFLLPVHFFYGMSTLSFMLAILFFSSSPALYFCSKRKVGSVHTYLFLLLSVLFFLIVSWQGGYFTKLSTLNSL